MSISVEELTKRQIIDETVKFYSEDPSRRAFYFEGNEYCVYQTKDGKNCAVGRCMIPDSKIQRWNNEYEMTTTTQIPADLIKNLEDILKPEYRGHNSHFWFELQKLHDTSRHWDDDGLTLDGKDYVTYLIGKYN